MQCHVSAFFENLNYSKISFEKALSDFKVSDHFDLVLRISKWHASRSQKVFTKKIIPLLFRRPTQSFHECQKSRGMTHRDIWLKFSHISKSYSKFGLLYEDGSKKSWKWIYEWSCLNDKASERLKTSESRQWLIPCCKICQAPLYVNA